MQPLSDLLTGLLSDAFEACALERKFGQVVLSQRPDLCQFQCNGALAAARIAKKNPRDIANEVIAAVDNKETYFSEISVAGAGYINLSLADAFLAQHAQAIAGGRSPALPARGDA